MPPTRKAAAPAELPADPAQQVLALVTGQCGAGSLLQMGDQPPQVVEVVSTGSVGLDLALGIGGLPRGRVTEIYGPEATGKTTLALHAIACAQRAGGVAVFIDAEHALDLSYARKLGVDTDLLLLSQPDSGEQALEIADICVRSRMVDIVVIDSVAALVPRAEIEGEMGASHIGLQARLMSQALRKLTGAIGSTKTTCIFINQLREKVGVFFGSPEVTSGGKALKFYASVRLDCRKVTPIKDGEEVAGHRLRVKVVKNKLAPPFREFTTDIIYGQGINREGELVDLGIACGAVVKSGSYYTLPGAPDAVNGRERARRYLAEHPDVAAEVEARVRASALVPAAPAPPVPSDLVDGSLADVPGLLEAPEAR